MKSLPKSKDGDNRREKSRKECQMAPLFSRKNTLVTYNAQAETKVTIHTLDASFVFGGRNVKLQIGAGASPRVTHSEEIILKSGKKRNVKFSMSTNDNAEFSFTSADPSGSNFSLSETSGLSHNDYDLGPCSAELSYGCLELEYGESGTTIRIDKTDDSYVLPIKSKKSGKACYDFYVIKHYANATLEDIIKGRLDRIRIPAVTHILLEKVSCYKDWNGHTVLQMKLTVDGKSYGGVCVEVVRPKDKAVPAMLHRIVSGEPLARS